MSRISCVTNTYVVDASCRPYRNVHDPIHSPPQNPHGARAPLCGRLCSWMKHENKMCVPHGIWSSSLGLSLGPSTAEMTERKINETQICGGGIRWFDDSATESCGSKNIAMSWPSSEWLASSECFPSEAQRQCLSSNESNSTHHGSRRWRVVRSWYSDPLFSVDASSCEETDEHNNYLVQEMDANLCVKWWYRFRVIGCTAPSSSLSLSFMDGSQKIKLQEQWMQHTSGHPNLTPTLWNNNLQRTLLLSSLWKFNSMMYQSTRRWRMFIPHMSNTMGTLCWVRHRWVNHETSPNWNAKDHPSQLPRPNEDCMCSMKVRFMFYSSHEWTKRKHIASVLLVNVVGPSWLMREHKFMMVPFKWSWKHLLSD